MPYAINRRGGSRTAPTRIAVPTPAPVVEGVTAELPPVPESPAYVYSEPELRRSADVLRGLAQSAGCKLLYAVKACGIAGVLETVAPYVDGFAVSSLFEARLARGVAGHGGTVHLTSPALIRDEVDELAKLCDYVSLNSLGQLARFGADLHGRASVGLRLNPGLSFVADDRYDPCRRHSKLGVGLERLVEVAASDDGPGDHVEGLHFHSNCDSTDFGQLLSTVRIVEDRLGGLLQRMKWINFGGGYLPGSGDTDEAFCEAVGLLRSRYGLEVFFEPGAAMVRESGYLVSTVLDLFDSGGADVAVLDTTVGHMPEVFEYQYRPEVARHRGGAPFKYILAGRSCLAGDVFGEYAFDEPLQVGSRVVFANTGAYTTVKAHVFNGINLPPVYAFTEGGELELKQRHTYSDFLSRYGAGDIATG